MVQTQNIIAIVYDYDRTLSPKSMQDDVLFSKIDVDSQEFWARANGLRIEKLYEDEPAWIRLLLENSAFRAFSNKDLRALGKDLTFYPGIPDIFRELNGVLKDGKYDRHGLALEHYIVTSGFKDMVAGSSLNMHVDAIFGCELDEDEDGKVFWPKRIVSHTSKTQYLFRITKGLEYVDFSRDVNDHMPESERRIPFRNILYIGDGPTDVPCFAVVSGRGGKSLAVYNPDSSFSFQTCMSLRDARRVDEIAEADYSSGTHLRRLIEHYVRFMADRIVSDIQQNHESQIIKAPKHG